MLRALKSYWAYASGWYKLVMLVVMPIALVVGYVFIIKENQGARFAILNGLAIIEAGADICFMNGAYCKGFSGSNFMLCSSKFPRVMREVAGVDCIRRMLVFQIPVLMEVMYATGSEEALLWGKSMLVNTWGVMLIAQICVFVARHFVEWQKAYVCVMIGFMVLMNPLMILSMFGIIFEVWDVDVLSFVIAPIFMVAFLIMSIVTVWYTGKKAKECYYD